jgi:hypothetical protein
MLRFCSRASVTRHCRLTGFENLLATRDQPRQKGRVQVLESRNTEEEDAIFLSIEIANKLTFWAFRNRAAWKGEVHQSLCRCVKVERMFVGDWDSFARLRFSCAT